MHDDFDQPPLRCGTDSLKWQRYGSALPLWVVDMDFTAPQAVLDARAQFPEFTLADLYDPIAMSPVLLRKIRDARGEERRYFGRCGNRRYQGWIWNEY